MSEESLYLQCRMQWRDGNGQWHDFEPSSPDVNLSALPIKFNKEKPVMKKFWMCLAVGGFMDQPPKHRHDTRAKAEAEAKRLAEVTGKQVFVLEAIYVAQRVAVAGEYLHD